MTGNSAPSLAASKRYLPKDLKAHTDLNMHALALVDPHDISNDEGSFKSLPIGKQRHDRYSHKAPQALREARDAGRVDEAKAALRELRRTKRRAP